jgi:hypothetical protein
MARPPGHDGVGDGEVCPLGDGDGAITVVRTRGYPEMSQVPDAGLSRKCARLLTWNA